MDKDVIYLSVYVYTMKKNEILPFAATWTDLEIIILSDISQRKTNTIFFSLVCEIWKKKKIKRYKGTYLWNRNRPTDIENKFMVTKGEREGGIN